MRFQVKPGRRIEHAGKVFEEGAIVSLPDHIAEFHWDNIDPVEDPATEFAKATDFDGEDDGES